MIRPNSVPADEPRGFFVGVDGGGTHTRALVVDAAGRERSLVEGGPGIVDSEDIPAAVRHMASVVAHALRDARGEEQGGEAQAEDRAVAAWFGLAGAGREAVAGAVREGLESEGIAERIHVGTDLEAAFQDAFGDGPGVLLVAGTGSVAMVRREDGQVLRSGGWGALLGDEGSAFAIGLRGLRAIARAHDRRGPETVLTPRILDELGIQDPRDLVTFASGASKSELASLAPEILAAAEGGDAVATQIRAEAASGLGSLLRAVLSESLPWREAPRLALSGGLLAPGRPLRSPVEEMARRMDLEVLPDLVRPERGAARLALRLAGL